MRRPVLVLAVTLLAAGVGLLGEQGWLVAKAALAERLIDRALAGHLADGRPHLPWSWADLQPVAEIRVPRLGVRRPVLTGASGSSLAFGIGHIDGTAPPGTAGNCALAGHRDGRMAFLRDLRPGDLLTLRSWPGERTYRVAEAGVVREDAGWVLDPGLGDRLTLVTCWPFGGLVGGRLRYVAVALPEPAAGVACARRAAD